MMQAINKNRIKRALGLLREERENCALLLSAAPTCLRSRDTEYPYRQDSDIFYFSACKAPDFHLLLISEPAQVFIFAPKFDAVKALWDGAPADFEQLATSLGAKLARSNDLRREILLKLKGVHTLYHQSRSLTLSNQIALELQGKPAHQRAQLPLCLIDCEELTQKLRLFKDAHEIELISKAATVTDLALRSTVKLIRPATRELEIAAHIDYIFAINECAPAFGTIVGSGKNAATLHYRKLASKLKKSDMLLIDCGAEHELYAADVTRVYPVSGSFNKQQALIYTIVLEAQAAAISKVKDGVLIRSVYDAAAKVITEGLKELRVLKGKTSELLKKQAYKTFFPHGIGHGLGLDVHDLGKLRGNNTAQLRKGMVFTIEPGLYFSKKTGSVLPCGIRIEDDVLVGKNSCTVLTSQIPKELSQVEALMFRASAKI